MGRSNKRIGRLHKNYEKKRKALRKKPTGRPKKMSKKDHKVGLSIVVKKKMIIHLNSRDMIIQHQLLKI